MNDEFSPLRDPLDEEALDAKRLHGIRSLLVEQIAKECLAFSTRPSPKDRAPARPFHRARRHELRTGHKLGTRGALVRLSAVLAASLVSLFFYVTMPIGAAPAALQWEPTQVIDTIHPYGTSIALNDLSCPSKSLCVATDNAGDILASNNPAIGAASWNTVYSEASNEPFAAVSCPSENECIAVGRNGIVLTSTNP